jgi:hypothetical protein
MVMHKTKTTTAEEVSGRIVEWRDDRRYRATYVVPGSLRDHEGRGDALWLEAELVVAHDPRRRAYTATVRERWADDDLMRRVLRPGAQRSESLGSTDAARFSARQFDGFLEDVLASFDLAAWAEAGAGR